MPARETLPPRYDSRDVTWAAVAALTLIGVSVVVDGSGAEVPLWVAWLWPQAARALEATLAFAVFLVFLGLPSDRCSVNHAVLAGAFLTASLFWATDAFLGFQPWPVEFPPLVAEILAGAHKRFSDVAELVVGAGLLASVVLPGRVRRFSPRERMVLALAMLGVAVVVLLAGAWWEFPPGAGGSHPWGARPRPPQVSWTSRRWPCWPSPPP